MMEILTWYGFMSCHNYLLLSSVYQELFLIILCSITFRHAQNLHITEYYWIISMSQPMNHDLLLSFFIFLQGAHVGSKLVPLTQMKRRHGRVGQTEFMEHMHLMPLPHEFSGSTGVAHEICHACKHNARCFCVNLLSIVLGHIKSVISSISQTVSSEANPWVKSSRRSVKEKRKKCAKFGILNHRSWFTHSPAC